jgi:hypothetical protein
MSSGGRVPSWQPQNPPAGPASGARKGVVGPGCHHAVLTRLGWRKVKHHVITRSEVFPGQVVLQGLVSIVLMMLAAEVEANEVSVRPRRGQRSATWTCRLVTRATPSINS